MAGVIAACRVKEERLSAQRIVIVGAGAGGIGIAQQLRSALEEDGLSDDALIEAIAVLDSKGMLIKNQT